ncbi:MULTISPECIES: hypothetical protein [Asticcacaulis]|uniref:hypothetical protein n=1 Tax=Asticcacaulis TaxID=76890 RepID=UPI001AE1C1EC|nr:MULTISPECIES: hypothetical protein [Asticcacaulis]MBP2160278.1 hypothetical protein [Asticcacaulis solisilvae]MDR6801419.1 hypothetical protein [Asticcacaulis sp. BE141]
MAVTTVASRSALKGLPTTLPSSAILTETGREGTFVLRSGAVPFSDVQEGIILPSTVTSGYYWERVFSGAANLLWFGADPTYTSDNWGKFQDALTVCATMADVPLYIPEGRYKFTTAPQILMNAFRTEGLLIYGDGQQRTILDLRTVTTSPNMTVRCTSTPVPDNYYLTVRDLGIVGDIDGVVLQLGEDNFADPVNMPRFQNVTVQNFAKVTGAIGVKMNYVVGGWFDMQVNCGETAENDGLGTALQLRQCQFNHFFGSYGTAQFSLKLQDGVNASNVFNCLDMENVETCVKIVNGNVSANTFIGGQWSYTDTGIDAVAGVSTLVINPTPAPITGGTSFVAAAGYTGVTIESRGVLPMTAPTLPASGVATTNETGRRANVAIWGGTVSAITINGYPYSGINTGFLTLEPGETIAVTYGTAPSWVWRE